MATKRKAVDPRRNEKKAIFLHYLGVVANADLACDEASLMLEWFSHIRNFFDSKNLRQVKISSVAGSKARKTMSFPRIRRLLALESKTFDIEAEWKLATKKIDDLFDLFKLPENTREPFRFICLLTIMRDDVLKRLWRFINDATFFSDITSENYKNIEKIVGCKPEDLAACLDQDGELFTKGILHTDGEKFFINPRFRQVLIRGLTTKDQFLKFLLGNKLKAELCADDFNYIDGERDYLSKLLSCAVKSGMPGVNILIYGNVGTGKTQMARTLAKIAGIDLYAVGASQTESEKKYRLAELAMTQVLLNGQNDTALIVDEAEDLLCENEHDGRAGASNQFLNDQLETNKTPIIWTANDLDDVLDKHKRRFLYSLELLPPDDTAKKNIWRNISRRLGFPLSEGDILYLTDRYPAIAPSFIEAGIRAALLTDDKNAIERTIDAQMKLMYGYILENEAFRSDQFDPELISVAADQDLKTLLDRLPASKSPTRNAFSLCLYGPDGAGKRRFAQYLAHKMGLNSIHWHISELYDPVIGADKSILGAFRYATNQNSMLIFSDVGVFLRVQRSMPWEISGTNKILTLMASTRNPFVCTTNLTDELDKEVLGQFTFKIKFDVLSAHQTETAFSRFFGQELPGGENLPDLVPGDFIAVKKKADILGITDADRLKNMLCEEARVKQQIHQLGFRASSR